MGRIAHRGSAAALILLLLTGFGEAQAEEKTGVALADLVFVIDDDADSSSLGCDSITIIDGTSGEPLIHGQYYDSPVRLSVSADGRRVVSPVARAADWLYVLHRSTAVPARWITSLVPVANLLEGGPAELSPFEDAIFVALLGSVAKFDVSKMTDRSIGPRIGRYSIPGMKVAEIVFARDPATLYLLDLDGHVHIVDAQHLTASSAPIEYEVPYTGPNQQRGRIRRTFATLSPDGRYLVVNGGQRQSVSVVDLASRRATTVTVPGLNETWGVAFNHSAENNGLLAIHGRNKLAVYEFHGTQVPVLLAAAEVPPQHLSKWWPPWSYCARIGALAWSGQGDSLIAATGHKKEYRVLALSDVGTPSLTTKFDFDACQSNNAYGFGLDVVTLNDRLPTPTPTTTPCPTPIPTNTSVATFTPSPTVTPSTTPTQAATATATPTPTRALAPVFLPLALKEHCDPTQLQADVALVIDASTSMMEETREKRTKLAAAVEAVELFLGELNLPLDQAAVVQFNGGVELLQGLTGDRGALVESLDRIQVKRQTRIDLGIQVAREELRSSRRRPGNQAVMIVLTDGRANPVGPDAAVREAQAAQSEGVTIFTIGLGEDLNLAALEAMASKPSYFYRAPDAEDLADIYSKIAIEIPCPAIDFWGQR